MATGTSPGEGILEALGSLLISCAQLLLGPRWSCVVHTHTCICKTFIIYCGVIGAVRLHNIVVMIYFVCSTHQAIVCVKRMVRMIGGKSSRIEPPRCTSQAKTIP